MCDRPTFLAKLGKVHPQPWVKGDSRILSSVIDYYDTFADTARLLRNGAFATMDELSFFAKGGVKAGEIRLLKKLMRLCLSLHGNEFAESDYQYLAQRLFANSLQRPADQVTVLSFNYDPILEHRLILALKTRDELRQNNALELDIQCCSSGFFNPADTKWVTEADRFKVLKLHGTLSFISHEGAYKMDGEEPYDNMQFMDKILIQRLLRLIRQEVQNQDPPVLLPWELIAEDGRMRSESHFAEHIGKDWQHLNLYPLFKGIWEEAELAVQQASKISLVGLSMSDYLLPGFRFLFRGRNAGAYQICCANETDFLSPRDPHSPSSRFLTFLTAFRPQIRPDLTAVNRCFKDFITDQFRDGILPLRERIV